MINKYVIALWADKIVLIVVILVLILTAGCQKSEQDWKPDPRDTKITNVTCYSYGKMIFQGQAKGRIIYWRTPPAADFTDAATGEKMLVMGDCVVGGQ